MSHSLRVALVAIALGLSACPATTPAPPRVPKGAQVLYDIDFSEPDQKSGDEVVTRELPDENPFPTRFPAHFFFGHPVVAKDVCGLSGQVAVLAGANATQGMTGLELPLLAQPYAHYHVELDLCISMLLPDQGGSDDPRFAIFLDVPEAHSIGFTPSGRVVLSDPRDAFENKPPKELGRFERNKPLKVAVDFDVMKGTLRVALDSKVVHDSPAPALLPRSVRLIVKLAQENVVAVDNVLIWAEGALPEVPVSGSEDEPESAPVSPAPGKEK